MGDMVEDLKALGHHRRAQKAEIWSRKDELVQQIEARGYQVKIDESGRRIRVYFSRSGYFDFWPTTGTWLQNMQPNGRQGVKGRDLDQLLDTMDMMRAPANTRASA